MTSRPYQSGWPMVAPLYPRGGSGWLHHHPTYLVTQDKQGPTKTCGRTASITRVAVTDVSWLGGEAKLLAQRGSGRCDTRPGLVFQQSFSSRHYPL